MNGLRSIILAGAILGVASSTTMAQDAGRAIPVGPRPGYVQMYSPMPPRAVPNNPVYRRTNPRFGRHEIPVRPHTHNYQDWTTGRENLPLAKPWLHGFR
jgi:hypothetical protein